MRGRKKKKKIFMGVVTYELWRTGGDILGDGHQVTFHGIHLDTQELCRWPQESIFYATSEPLPKVDKGSLGRLYEALGGRSDVIDFFIFSCNHRNFV
jgi:hypothetical protein